MSPGPSTSRRDPGRRLARWGRGRAAHRPCSAPLLVAPWASRWWPSCGRTASRAWPRCGRATWCGSWTTSATAATAGGRGLRPARPAARAGRRAPPARRPRSTRRPARLDALSVLAGTAPADRPGGRGVRHRPRRRGQGGAGARPRAGAAGRRRRGDPGQRRPRRGLDRVHRRGRRRAGRRHAGRARRTGARPSATARRWPRPWRSRAASSRACRRAPAPRVASRDEVTVTALHAVQTPRYARPAATPRPGPSS